MHWWAIFDCESSGVHTVGRVVGAMAAEACLYRNGEWVKGMISGAVKRQQQKYVRRPTTTQQQRWPCLIFQYLFSRLCTNNRLSAPVACEEDDNSTIKSTTGICSHGGR